MKLFHVLVFGLLFTVASSEIGFSDSGILFKNSSGEWVKTNAAYILSGDTATLKFPVDDADSIIWRQIIPDISKLYKNANFPWEEGAYSWTGFCKIEYRLLEISEFKNQTIVEITPGLLLKNQPVENTDYNAKTGSFWFQAIATLKNGKIVRTKGLEDNDEKGLSPEVFRISIIENTDYIGYLTSFFNVPGLFGAIPYQSKNYIGIDCADVLMAAKAIMENKPLEDFNVARMIKTFRTIRTLKVRTGIPDAQLRWNDDFRPGDFIAVKYDGYKQFGHIGMLYRDENANNVLDENDLIIHAGLKALAITRLVDGLFDGQVKILERF